MTELVLLGFGLAAVVAVGIAVTDALVRRAEVGGALLLGCDADRARSWTAGCPP